jgi:hypothetical protein
MPLQDSQSIQSLIFKLKLENNSKAIDLLQFLFEKVIQKNICSLWSVYSDNNEKVIAEICRDIFAHYKSVCDDCQSAEGLMVSMLIDILKDPRLRTTIDMSNVYSDITVRSLAISLNENLWVSEILNRDTIYI